VTNDEVEEALLSLFGKYPNGFRNKHLAQALGVSRARASQLLSARVRWRELTALGDFRLCYVRGPAFRNGFAERARGAADRSFWEYLVASCRQIAYVRLRTLTSADLRTRSQVRHYVQGVAPRAGFLIVDFDGVSSVSDSALGELFLSIPENDMAQVKGINMAPEVAQRLRRFLS
jgi:hypothetical protein